MNIKKATDHYEMWLATQTSVIKQDLELKHKNMANDIFSFLRATFYRWAQIWPVVCEKLKSAPEVLAVGDLHVENFGTWRDVEGRLIWGVNDFDEAWQLPYTNDLVRLATSAIIAIYAQHLKIDSKDACESILKGYRKAIEEKSSPFVLAEDHEWLRKEALNELRNPERFWKKMRDLPDIKEPAPANVINILESQLPEQGLSYRIAKRTAGLGSLGRQRFTVIADWRGGKVAREAKALLPSACFWADNGKGSGKIMYQTILDQAVRCQDPYVKVKSKWVIRRLAPDCSRIELSSLSSERDELRLLSAMGRETANIHLSSKKEVEAIKIDLKARSSDWLYAASKDMVKAIENDWKEWKS